MQEQTPPMSSALGDYIEQERNGRNWSYRELEDRTGISRGALYDMQTGKTKTPKLETLYRISKAFGVPLNRLLTIAGFPVEPLADNAALAKHLAELGEALPWIAQIVDDLAKLTPDQKEGVVAYMEAIRRQRSDRSS
jgi:transcriptional regulator with XRE-family HTH domain